VPFRPFIDRAGAVALGTQHTGQVEYAIVRGDTGLMESAEAYQEAHGGELVEALSPFAIHMDVTARVSRCAAELADTFAPPYRTADSGGSETFGAARDLGVSVVLAQADGQGPLPEVNVPTLTDGTRRALHEPRVLDGAAPTDTRTTGPGEISRSRSTADGCWYPAMEAGKHDRADQPLGVVIDVLVQVQQEPRSTVGRIVMFGVTNLAIHDGDLLLGVGSAS